MTLFPGFSDNRSRSSSIPDEFFSQLLMEIQDLDELKVTLHVLWFLAQKDRSSQWISWKDFTADELFLRGLAGERSQAVLRVKNGLSKALQRNTILTNHPEDINSEDCVFVLNSPLGKATLKRISNSHGEPLQISDASISLERDRPNIFTLYEQHIGPLTPMISETLQEAENEYPAEWLTDAVQVAVKNNVRRWTYIEAILKRWKQEGRNEKERRDHPEDRRKYVNGEYGDIIEH